MHYLPLPQSFLEALERHPSSRTLVYREADAWKEISSVEMLRRVARFSAALADLGVKAGDRVALLAPNCPEWHIADFAITGLGAVVVPIYFKESADRTAYIVEHSGARVAFAVGDEQVARLAACRNRVPALQTVVAAAMAEALPPGTMSYEALIAGAPDGSAAASDDSKIAEYRRRAAEVRPEQMATLIYTSGTTGEPKGVMLSHHNLSSNVTDGIRETDFERGNVALSFLPLSHIYERTVDYGYLFRGVTVAYVRKMEDVPQALLEVRPHYAAAVPRFFEKIYANIMERGRRGPGWRRKVFDWGIAVADRAKPWRAYGRPVALGVRLQWKAAERLVYSRIRAGIGGRIKKFVSGSGPLTRELAEFFWSIGLEVYQGYGLTESSPIVSTNVPGSNRMGTAGPVIANVTVRIAPDGEILVKGPCVMMGYYRNPEATQEALDSEGWLHTGDIGTLDADNYLSITDRKKDLLKTSGGKFVAPQPLENALKSSPYISNAAVVGDRRKFPAALIVPNFANVEAAAKKEGLAFASANELAAHPWTRALLEREVKRIMQPFAQYERIKRFALLDRDFTLDSGELTYTMKLKRRVIEERYRDTIEQLYADVAEPHPPALQ
jgi:long-chain acyl-CoA synthetase